MKKNLASLGLLQPKTKYNSLIYNNGVVSVWDIVNNKPININNKLFNEAINRMIKDKYSNLSISEFYNKYSILYNKKYNFDESTVIIIKDNNKVSFTKIDLTPYWPSYNYLSKDNNVIMIDNKITNDEIIYIDYVRNEATLYNRESNIKYNIKLDRINKNSIISSYYSLDDTFTNLRGNI